MLKRLSFIALLACLSAAAWAASPEFGAGANWTNHSGGDDDGGYSRLADINDKNIGTLGIAGFLDLPGEHSLEATPLAVDGVLYFTGTYSMAYAVDAVTSKILWKYDPENWKRDNA